MLWLQFNRLLIYLIPVNAVADNLPSYHAKVFIYFGVFTRTHSPS